MSPGTPAILWSTLTQSPGAFGGSTSALFLHVLCLQGRFEALPNWQALQIGTSHFASLLGNSPFRAMIWIFFGEQWLNFRWYLKNSALVLVGCRSSSSSSMMTGWSLGVWSQSKSRVFVSVSCDALVNAHTVSWCVWRFHFCVVLTRFVSPGSL